MVLPAADDPAEVIEQLWHGISGDLAFEVGANVGRSLPRMKMLFRQVVAFEPYLPAWEIASRAVPGVSVWPVAVSDHDGWTELNLVADQFQSQGHEAYHRANPAERQQFDNAERVPCRSLDSLAYSPAFSQVPDFVNMDVEGHELAVLQGATALMADRPPGWLIEFHSRTLYDDCTECLHDFGYATETIRHPHYLPGSVNYYEHGWIRAFPQTRAPSRPAAAAIRPAAVPCAT